MSDSTLVFQKDILNCFTECELSQIRQDYRTYLDINSNNSTKKEKPKTRTRFSTKKGQLTIWGNNDCPNPVYFVNKKSHKINKGDCGSWHCSVCTRKKARKVQRRAIRAAIRIPGFVRFLTLTCKTDENIMEDWNNLLTQLRKQEYIDQYFWVKEFQVRGTRHLHIIFWGKFIPWTTIKKYWEGNIKIEKGNRKTLHYLVKYLGDVEKQELFDKGERRYSSSRGFFEQVAKKIPTYEWEIYGSWMEGYKDIVIAYEQQNNDIETYKSKFIIQDYHPEYQKHLEMG